MFITNLTKNPLGVNGLINLAPFEVNHYIDDKDKDLVERVALLEAAKLISVIRTPGLTKVGIPGKVVKTIGVDTTGLTEAPRSVSKGAAPKKTQPVTPPVMETPEVKEAVAEEAMPEEVTPEAAASEAEVVEVKETKPAKASRAKSTKASSKAKTEVKDASEDADK